MKGKEEDEERNENICPQRTNKHTNKQKNSSNTEPLYSPVDRRGSGPITEENTIK